MFSPGAVVLHVVMKAVAHWVNAGNPQLSQKGSHKVTRPTFQTLRSLLKVVAPVNMETIVVTLTVFQELTSPLKAAA
jgi:hypothetical protein